MPSQELLSDAFGRIRDAVHQVLEEISSDQLAYRIDGKSNSIAWLMWHLTRVQDDHVAAALGLDQLWTSAGWDTTFGLNLDLRDTGYGHSPEQVAAVNAPAQLLRDYHDSVCDRTLTLVRGLTEADLATVVDTRWNPPITLAVRLISVVADDLEHVGQAAFIRGLITS